MIRTCFFMLAIAGCTQKPYTTLGNENWSSPMDGDLKIAMAGLSTAMADTGDTNVHPLWAGARFHQYELYRETTGIVVRKYAQIEFAFSLPNGKCYLDSDFSTLESGPMLVRESVNGRFEAPHITGFIPAENDHEILCSAVTAATSGVKEPFGNVARQ